MHKMFIHVCILNMEIELKNLGNLWVSKLGKQRIIFYVLHSKHVCAYTLCDIHL